MLKIPCCSVLNSQSYFKWTTAKVRALPGQILIECKHENKLKCQPYDFLKVI